MDNLKLIKKARYTKFELRKTLQLPSTVTFGTEIEFEFCDLTKMQNLLKSNNLNNYRVVRDSTLISGGEVVSPVLKDGKETWQELTKVLKLVRDNAEVYHNTGGHIHVGAQIFKKESDVLNFLYLWMLYEDIIYRFSYGEFKEPRDTILISARPCGKKIEEILQNNMHIRNIHIGKIYGLSLNYFKNFNFEMGNTLEIRCPNGSFSPEIWQNNINCFVKLMQYATSDEVDYKKSFQSIIAPSAFNIEDYNNLNLEKACLLADQIFETEKDKLLFLKEYIKGEDFTAESFSTSAEIAQKKR